ncbi:MAG: hypothetical protein AAGA20_11650 [Planctomycetota bacterium]
MTTTLHQTEVVCSDGRFLIDEALVRRIVESYYRATANLQFATTNELDSSWFEPSMTSYDVDWKKARTWTEQQASSKLSSTWLVSLPRMQPRIEELQRMQRETAVLTAKFRKNMQDVADANRESRERMISFWGGATDVARTVRDASASTLMVGASVLTAGGAAALFAGGAGTALRFTAKLQDGKGKWQDNLGAAAVQASGDLIFTFIPATKAGAVMRGAKGAEKAAIMFLEATWDTTTSMLEGKEVSEALLDGSMTLLFSAGADSALLGTKGLRDEITAKLTDSVVPMAIRATGSKSGGVQMAKTLARGARSRIESGMKSRATAGANHLRIAPSSGGISNGILEKDVQRNGLDNAAVVDPTLVERAVVKLGV